MKPPPGLLLPNNTHVCKLQRSLYGLRQAGRQWYAKLSNFLLSHNYILSTADNSLFLKHKGTNTTALLVYVDDIVLTGNDTEEIARITNLLDQQFKIKNLGDLTYFLGLKVARNSTGVHLWQRKYTLVCWTVHPCLLLCSTLLGSLQPKVLPCLTQTHLPTAASLVVFSISQTQDLILLLV